MSAVSMRTPLVAEDLSTRFVRILKTDTEKQLLWGEVYRPHTLDSQGDFMSPDQIERMAHSFMKSGLVSNIDTEHSLRKSGACVVESFVARPGDPDFVEGAWVLGVWCPDTVWKLVKAGEINGFSMYGSGERVEKAIEIEVPDDGLLEGRVHKSDDHDHEVVLKLDDQGRIVGGETSKDHDHFHLIKQGTSTEFAGVRSHSHRFSLADVLAETIQKADARNPNWRNTKRLPSGKFATPDGASSRGVTSPESHPHLQI